MTVQKLCDICALWASRSALWFYVPVFHDCTCCTGGILSQYHTGVLQASFTNVCRTVQMPGCLILYTMWTWNDWTPEFNNSEGWVNYLHLCVMCSVVLIVSAVGPECEHTNDFLQYLFHVVHWFKVFFTHTISLICHYLSYLPCTVQLVTATQSWLVKRKQGKVL